MTCVVILGSTLAGVEGCGNSKPASPVNNDDGGSGDVPGDGASNRPAQKLVILHTNDLHSHFMGQGPEADYTPATIGDDSTVGGLARLAAAIKTARIDAVTDDRPALLLDAGDFMMGTLFETLALSDAPELRFMQEAGYDATTIGNHELDWTPRALAGILQAYVAGNATTNMTDKAVPILSSNMKFSDDDAGDDDLKAFFDAGVIRTKLVKTVGTLKVGLFGLIGADAVQVTPQAAPLTFDQIESAASRMVTELRLVDQVDLVIALSHSGIDSKGAGEDARLASNVPGIDVIISGHTHDTLAEPVTVDQTVIVTAGSYGRYLGNLQLSVTPAATPGGVAAVEVDGYTLQPIDDTIVGDPETEAQVDGWITKVDQQLASANLAYRKVVASTGADLTLPTYAEAPVGNLVADAYLKTGAALLTDPPVIAVEANGQLRAPILKGLTGQVWLSDLFRVTPIGIGPDQKPGFPLVTFYLSAKDIRSGLELGAARPTPTSPGLVPDQYFLQISGIKAEYDMNATPFGRVTSLTLVNGIGETKLDINDTTQCYRVIATNYVAGLLGVVKSFTRGLLSVTAKDKTCTTAVDPTQNFVDASPMTPEVDELKHWQAVLGYVSNFPKDAMGIPVIPAVYGAPQGRITEK